MTPELWERLKPLFHAALECPQGERTKFLDEACTDDPELKPHLQGLIAAEEQGTGPIDGAWADLSKMLEHVDARFQPGEVVLDRFRIVRFIDGGGMGEVYEAVDLQLGPVALKTIRREISASVHAYERFRQEVQLARRVSGAQVCRIHELFLLPATGVQPATAFLSMEYLDGVTLARKLSDDGPMDLKQARAVALEICKGLRLIHEKGVIHRDLKTGNVMVCQDNGATRTVLMDFGLAQDVLIHPANGDSTTSVVPMRTMQGAIVGTPTYMAPEQFEEGGELSPATDIYALGIILYELVTGKHPYSASTPLGAAIRRARTRAPASTIRRNVPRHWDSIIERCLEYDPKQRFQSAGEVEKALRAGPANFDNLRRDRPWLLRAGYALALALFAWAALQWWQERQQYHPSQEGQRAYDTGVAALREGDYVKATRSLERATAVDYRYVMAHARLAEAWSNLDFDGNAQKELLIASPGQHDLPPLDRMYFDAIHAIVIKDTAAQVTLYRHILDRLPSDQKAIGYVDLGMAYEHAGDPALALQNYKKAEVLDKDNPAAYMHTAILQSRQHHVAEADQAFQDAQDLLSLEMNQEGLAELDYQRGYSANDRGDLATALPFLEKALNEARAIPSVQLQIRCLTQLSAVAYLSNQYDQAVKDAQDAIHLAQTNQLDVWAANGYVRLANAELHQGNLDKAEAALQEAVQLAHGSQGRTEAGANLTLASIMNQRRLPDKVIPPAKAALDYYTQNGFFEPAANASLLLIRTQRDKGELEQALSSGKAFQVLAAKSGMHKLPALADEVVGTVYLEMEQYPSALQQFQKAREEAEGNVGKAYQALHCAETLWRLGRFSESDQMLSSVPTTPTFQGLIEETRVPSLLGRGNYREVDALAHKMLNEESPSEPKTRWRLEAMAILAAARQKHIPEARHRLETMAAGRSNDALPDWNAQLNLAESELLLGMLPQALSDSDKAAQHFSATKQLDSELKSAYIGASAARILVDQAHNEQFSKKAVDILSQLQHTWEPQNLKSYLSRHDLQTLAREAGIPGPVR